VAVVGRSTVTEAYLLYTR